MIEALAAFCIVILAFGWVSYDLVNWDGVRT